MAPSPDTQMEHMSKIKGAVWAKPCWHAAVQGSVFSIWGVAGIQPLAEEMAGHCCQRTKTTGNGIV